ncbi:TIGR02594 family protein [Methylobacterium sp. 77]|uniref:NlpC/P60 family protein n=1 Tax=Methylobacterium sp. 77 TaxID=1101192 RepID=UPI0009DB7128|nr:TIGR02594 family protein [Methylobacterium sp. 77]
MDVLTVQKTLQYQGINPGDIDGIWGRKTVAAVKLFQKVRGLQVDGIVGPVTAQALFGIVPNTSTGQHETNAGPLVWYQEAVDLIGIREIPGRASNEDIIKWAVNLNIDFQNDDIPWCGLFTAHCIGSTLPDEVLPKHPLLARNWAKFGDSCTPRKGAILVFWRGQPNGVFGHVGFYKSEDDDAFHVLGGNTNNSVSVARIAKSRLIDSRWPRTASSISGDIVHTSTNEPFSHNEA